MARPVRSDEKAVFVLGMARSGTSAVARVVTIELRVVPGGPVWRAYASARSLARRVP